MGAPIALTLPLAETASFGEGHVGGKAAKLARLISSGYRVPTGFCITTEAYRRFVEQGGLENRIDMEIARKPISSMRWEEIWDAALRVRTAFLRTPIPGEVSEAITSTCADIIESPLVVRSSAVGEDSAERSYAGLHESVVGVVGANALLDAVRIVWASLWSDAALLYRSELQLKTRGSAMAVVVQELVAADRSGVSFGRDPRAPSADRQVIEAVPGLCQDLVDGNLDPDRWLVRRSNGDIIEWYPGNRPGEQQAPLLENEDVAQIHSTLNSIEYTFGWPPDIEWTGRGSEFTVLQARPVTSKPSGGQEDKREWYLSLRPGRSKLAALCERVTEELIPALEAEGHRLARESIEDLPDAALADTLDARAETYERWKKTYWDEFIPFAHGVRQLGTYYNDAVQPDDPYEFVGMLRNQPMIAGDRNKALRKAAGFLTEHAELLDLLRGSIDTGDEQIRIGWLELERMVEGAEGSAELLEKLRHISTQYMDVAYEDEQLDNRPDLVLHAVVQMAAVEKSPTSESPMEDSGQEQFEQRLLAAVGTERRDEARSVIEIARLSWRLRDDDNVLLGRVERQLLRAASIAAERLQSAGRLDPDARVSVESVAELSAALRNSDGGRVELTEPKERSEPEALLSEGEKPRQIVGQPAAPGLVTGKARVVRTPDDLSRFRAGEVLVCDAIQPTMSHIVPLAAGIVERRGGMLIHGAIIARELGVPCVNGVSESFLSIGNGEILTVDGHLGIVTIGPPEFDLETADSVTHG